MATFQIPQFIEEKPKIISFLTLKQFLMLGGAVVFSITIYYIFSLFLWFVLSAITLTVTLCLAFLKINGQEMTSIAKSAFAYFWNPRVYVWSRAMEETSIDTSSIEKLTLMRKTMGIQQKIKAIAEAITTGKSPQQLDESGIGQKPRGGNYEVVTYLTGEKRVAKRIDY